MVGTSRKRRFLAGILTATAIGAAFCLVFHFNLLSGMQLLGNDSLFKAANLHPAAEPDEKIVIVAIDDKSVEQLGHFSSWPRSYHAQLIDTLADAEARTVVFDVLFSEPTAYDEQLATSIEHAENVVLPMVMTFTIHNSTATGKTIELGSTIKPLEIFEENVLAIGHANVLADEDGIVRRLPLLIPNGEHYEPALALAAVAKYIRRSQVIESPIQDNNLPFAGRSISLDSANSMLINYTNNSAEPLNFDIVSYADILERNIPLAYFQDKLIVIGITATGLGDTFWTPMGKMKHGVELHASAMHTILAGNFLKPTLPAVTMTSILVSALLCGLAVLHFRALWATLSAGFLCIAYFLIAFSFFDHGILLNMLYPPLAIAGTFVGVNLYNVVSERAEKREITNAFGRYVSPPVVDKILAASGEGELKLGGEEREVTTLFADVRNFTGISERTQPQELVNILNTYLSVIVKTVLKYDGMINKFGGDSVMAIWNVPIACEEHALFAIKAAVSAQRAIEELRERETTLPKMEFGIGINTGEAVAGNMGSEHRLEYSVIGDAVNTAARLADAAPGSKVWIGANTFAQAKDYVKAEPLKPLAVKGKRRPIQAYEVSGVQNGGFTTDETQSVKSGRGRCNKS